MTSRKPRRGRPLTISLFGHFGSSNAGNEATLAAILWELRARYPDAEFRCICTYPESVVERYDIDAIPITTRAVRIWDRQVPVAGRVPLAVAGLVAELAQYLRALRELGRTDMLIIPGTGLVTDAFGLSPFGPYSQFKWVLAAKARRNTVLFVSVGAGPIHSRAAEVLVKATLSIADYRSYRDQASKECLRTIGVRVASDHVYPDLVFGPAGGPLTRHHRRLDRERRVVGLGLMVYDGRYSGSGPDARTYDAYLTSLADFARWLLERGYDLRLLLGDGDAVVIEDFRSKLNDRIDGVDPRRIVAQPAGSVQDLLDGIATTDILVATRFHNVLMAILLGKPVLAISFHHKCVSLMSEIGLSEYCHEIHGIDTSGLIVQFQQLEQNESAVADTLARATSDARVSLAEQYDRLFSSPHLEHGDRLRDRSQGLESAFLRANQRVWRGLPARVRDSRPARGYGSRLHSLVSRRADQQMYLGTLFLRNRPALELVRRLVEREDQRAPVKIAVLGCSIGVEVYSIIWALRRSRPDLRLEVQAVDISPEVIEVAERAVYSPAESELVDASIFDRLTAAERTEMFDWNGDHASIKPWMRDGITWRVGDAGDPRLIAELGPQDVVIANNFLCHMGTLDAQRCLRNFAQLVRRGGHLLVTGVDLDVRTEVAIELGWLPLSELRSEIHDGDPLVRSDWPLRWWGLEPFDRRRRGWETRYSAAFRIGYAEPAATATPTTT